MLNWILCLALIAPQSGSESEEPIYVTAQVLRQKGPSLGRVPFRKLLQTAVGEMRPVTVRLLEETPVVVQVEAVRGPVLMVDGGEAWPGPRAVALLVVTEERSLSSVYWQVDLYLLGLNNGLPRVLGHQELTPIDFEPGVSSGRVALSTFRIHPRAVALGVTAEFSETAETEHFSSKSFHLFAAGKEDMLVDLYQRDPLSEDEVDRAGQFRLNTTTKLHIDRTSRIGGLFRLISEQREDEYESKHLVRTETLYAWNCFVDGAYEECSPNRE